MIFPKLEPKPYQKGVYRNIFTNPGEHILKDIAAEADYELVDQVIQLTSGIDHSLPQYHRPFQYGRIEDADILAVFQRQNWGWGRFGDSKSYGVWYGAEEELTSVYEAVWVASRLAMDNTQAKGEVYTTDRAMYRAEVASERIIDLTGEKDNFTFLIHPNDYSYCQALGNKLVESAIEGLRTPSARRRNGICAPLFAASPIRKVERIFYLKIHINPDASIGVQCSQAHLNLSLNTLELVDPYGINS